MAGTIPPSQLRGLEGPGTTWPGLRDHRWHRELEEGEEEAIRSAQRHFLSPKAIRQQTTEGARVQLIHICHDPHAQRQGVWAEAQDRGNPAEPGPGPGWGRDATGPGASEPHNHPHHLHQVF